MDDVLVENLAKKHQICARCGKEGVHAIRLDNWDQSFPLKPKHKGNLKGKIEILFLCSNCFKKWSLFYHSKDDTVKSYKWEEAWLIFEEELKYAGVETFILG